MTDPRQKARALIEDHTTTLHGLWIRYWGEGGNASAFEFAAYIHELLEREPYELDILSWAIEELESAPSRQWPLL